MDITVQWKQLKNYSGYAYIPASDMDFSKSMECEPNKLLKAKMQTVRKPRSVQQLNAYFACCGKVADNTSNPDFNHKDKVDLQLRIKLGLIDYTLKVDDRIHFVPKSISFKTLKHLEACNYFDRAFEVMSKFLGCTVEELLSA